MSQAASRFAFDFFSFPVRLIFGPPPLKRSHLTKEKQKERDESDMKHEASYFAQDVGALLSWAMNGERASVVS